MMLVQWLIALPPALLIAAVFAYPVRTHPGIWFGVSVPVDFPDTFVARSLQNAYRLRCAGLLLLSLATTAIGIWSNHPALLPIAIAIEVTGAFALWSLAVRAARPYAVHTPLVRTASLGEETPRSFAWGTLLLLTALLPLALSAFYLQSHYADIPLRFPRHWDHLSSPDGWTNRTPLQVFVPLLVGAFLVAFFYVLQNSWIFGTGRTTRTMQPILGSIAWLMSVLFSFRAVAPLFLSPTRSVAILLDIAGVGTLACSTAILWMYHRASKATGAPYDGTPDNAWYAGVFYYNPNDAALFVPKRLGYGWTLNFGHRRAWMWMLFAFTPLIGGLLFKHFR